MDNENMLTFQGEVLIEASEKQEQGQAPKFQMVANTGIPVWLYGFDEPVVVDFAGLDISRQHIPIRLDHDPEKRIGHTTEIKVEDNKLLASGVISHDNEYSRTVAASGKNGFPWQASIGAIMLERLDLKNNETLEVNGQMVEGPAIIAVRSDLREISFCDYGADPNTSAVISAKEREQERVIVMEDKKEEVLLQEAEAPKTELIQEEKVDMIAETRRQIEESRKILAEEQRRVAAINAISVNGDVAEIRQKGIAEGWSPEKTELEMLRAARPEAPAVHKVERSVDRGVVEAVGLRASGRVPSTRIEAMFDPQTLEAADRYHGIGIRDYFELAAGRPLGSARLDMYQWMHAAFDATSLPGILSNTANKVLLAGYEAADDCWREFCKVGSVSDFKTHTRYRMLSNFKFEKVGRGGEIPHGEISEQQFSQKIETYGIMFSLTRQMIIDDDLGALYDIPFQIGVGAAQQISRAVWSLVLANPTQADGYAFFSTQHDSLLTGATNALSINGLSAAEVAFAKKLLPNKQPIGTRPSYLLVPPELRQTAEMLMASANQLVTTTTDYPTYNMNPHQGKYRVLCSPYLSIPWWDEETQTTTTPGSSTAYYLVANPNLIPAFEVAFLGGQDRPTIQRADADFNTLGVQFRGFIDFGVKEQDYRGILKVTGAN